jgi:hypothetical protein
MDDLDLRRSADRLVEDTELQPPPLAAVRQQARRYRRRVRARVIGAGALPIAGVAVVAAFAVGDPDSSSPTQQVSVGPPTTTATPSSTETAPPTSAVAQPLLPTRTESRVGDLDVLQYTFKGVDLANGDIAATADAIWFTDDNRLFRFDPEEERAAEIHRFVHGVQQLVANDDTVFAVTFKFVNVGVAQSRIIAIDSRTGATRWSTAAARDTPGGLSVAGSTLWAIGGGPSGPEAVGFDAASGTVTQRVPIPVGGSLFATEHRLWIGGEGRLVRVDLGAAPSVTTIEVDGGFEPTAADEENVWGFQPGVDHTAPSFFYRRSADGEVLASFDCNALVLGRDGGWCTPLLESASAPTDVEPRITVVDPLTGAVLAAAPMEPRELPFRLRAARDGRAAWGIRYDGTLLRFTRP